MWNNFLIFNSHFNYIFSYFIILLIIFYVYLYFYIIYLDEGVKGSKISLTQKVIPLIHPTSSLPPGNYGKLSRGNYATIEQPKKNKVFKILLLYFQSSSIKLTKSWAPLRNIIKKLYKFEFIAHQGIELWRKFCIFNVMFGSQKVLKKEKKNVKENDFLYLISL